MQRYTFQDKNHNNKAEIDIVLSKKPYLATLTRVSFVYMFQKSRFILKFHSLILITTHILLGQTTIFSQCKQPIAIIVSDKTTNSVIISWSDPNTTVMSYEIEVVKRGSVRSELPNVPSTQVKMTTLTGLEPSASYEIYVRASCSAGNVSKWTGPITFTTNLTNPTHCQTELPIRDNGSETFIVEVETEGMVGKDIFLESVDFIIAHTWPADLEITLEAPNGSSMILSKNNGLLNDNYGDVHDSLCKNVTSVSPYACLSFKNSNPPYTGSFIPDVYVRNFAKGSQAKGQWKIHFRDRAAKDIGILKFFQIKFNTDVCQPSDATATSNVSDKSFVFDWQFPDFCSNTILYVIPPVGDTLTTFFNCRESNALVRTIQNLSPNTTYQYYSQNQCIDVNGNVTFSRFSCQKSVHTSCAKLSATENFNQLSSCDPTCNIPCPVNGQVFNSIPSTSQWIVYSGATPTEATGPDNDISGNGKYCYIENSPDLCGINTSAILESKCLKVFSNGDTCDMHFAYHMEGSQTGSLVVRITKNNGTSWDTIFYVKGNQNNKWNRAALSLAPYQNEFCTIQFIGITGDGIRGDIAIDQVEFYGSELASDADITHYIDADNDGYGSPAEFIQSCIAKIDGYSTIGGDCHDDNPNIHPGKVEITCNGIDENCNGMNDDLPAINPILYTATTKRASCAGVKDGAITVTINGGNPPYSVLWNDGNTQSIRTNLLTGVYHATITDTDGCKRKTEFFNIQASTTINIIETITNPTCEGIANGAITLNHSMDNPPYLYKWSNDATTKDINNLNDGTYSVIISDAKGCVTGKSNIKITANPSVVISTKNFINPLCETDSLGSIEILPSGGVMPYTYLWSNQNTTSKIEAVKTGIYSVTVQDTRGCKASKEYEIKTPEQLYINIIGVDNTRCSGENNGAIRTKITGGTPPYTYNWNNFAYTTDDIFNLNKGQYNLTVSDNNGCRKTLPNPIIISEPDPIVLTLDSLSGGRCLSGGGGYVSINSSGGSPPYTFDWLHIDTSTSVLKDIKSGIYNVAASDAPGCKSNQLIVTVPAILLDLHPDIALKSDNKCFGDSNGSIVGEVTKGKAPYDFNWSSGRQLITGINIDSIDQLQGGTYNLTVTDADGCTGISKNVIITQPGKITYSIADLVFNTCREDKNGLIAININGGSPPYDVNWNNGTYAGNLLFSLPNGTYGALIKDKNECTDSIQSIELISKSDISSINAIKHASPDKNDGNICLVIIGGAEPYRTTWSTGTKDTTCISQLAPGTYYVDITDDLGCELSDTFIVERINATSYDFNHKIKLYPNPASSAINISSVDNLNLEKVEIFNAEGSLVHKNSQPEYVIPIQDLSSGIYLLKLSWSQQTDITSYHRFIKMD